MAKTKVPGPAMKPMPPAGAMGGTAPVAMGGKHGAAGKSAGKAPLPNFTKKPKAKL